MKQKVWDITVKDNPNRVVMGENDEFYTTDTEAFLVFNLQDKEFSPTTAVLTLENRNDGSLKNETVDVVDGLIEWEMPQRYIEHFGNWQGQLVYEDTKDGQPELYTSAPFTFVVNAHIGDKKKPSLVEIENWEKFIRDGTELIESWEDMEDLRQANEAQRQSNYQELLDTGVLQTNINNKLEDLETEYAPRLTNLEQNDVNLNTKIEQSKTEVTAQLAQTENQMNREVLSKKERKPMMTFIDDDGRSQFKDKWTSIIQEKNVPVTVCLITSRVGAHDFMTSTLR